MLATLSLVMAVVSGQVEQPKQATSASLESVYRLGPQEILDRDPLLRAAAEAFERKLGKQVNEVVTKTRQVPRTVYRAVEQRYGLFGRKCRIVYVPQTIQVEENYQETVSVLRTATLLATVPDDEAGRGDARADFRASPPPLEALAKRIRIQLARLSATEGLSLEIQEFIPIPGSGPDNVVIAEPGTQARFSPVVGLSELPPDVQERLRDKRIAYSIIARIDELNDNRVVHLITRVAFDSSSGASTVDATAAAAAAQLLANRLQKELAPSGM